MPHGPCHFTVNASDRSEVPATDTSSKMDEKEQSPCSLQVQKLCCLHYNVLLHTPGLEPYPTPLPLSNIKIPLVHRYNFDMPCNMGSGDHGTASPRTERTPNLAAGWSKKTFYLFAALTAALYQSSLSFDRAKHHFSANRVGKRVCLPVGNAGEVRAPRLTDTRRTHS